MFKVGKLNDVNNEKLEVDRLYFTKKNFIKKTSEEINALRFSYSGNIGNDEYSLSFALNCPDEVIMKFPLTEKVDLKDYIFEGETFFVVNNEGDIDPYMDISIMKYFNNTFIINARIQTSNKTDEIYTATLEFEFNLNDYIVK